MVLPAVAHLSTMRVNIAVIGCGNPNRGDDGAGAEVVRLLTDALGEPRPVGLRLLDAGTDGMGVMFAARGCETLILVDACKSDSEPGAVFEAPGDALEAPPKDSFNLHDFRWDHALFAGRRIYGEAFPTNVTVFLIEAGNLDFGIGLTPPVAAAVQKVALRIRDLIAASNASGPS
jgi:hydrogenase maturation protease